MCGCNICASQVSNVYNFVYHISHAFWNVLLKDFPQKKKANGKTTTLQLFLDSLSPKTEKLSLEGTMDLSRDRLILELVER
jgi:hypothetical protein